MGAGTLTSACSAASVFTVDWADTAEAMATRGDKAKAKQVAQSGADSVSGRRLAQAHEEAPLAIRPRLMCPRNLPLLVSAQPLALEAIHILMETMNIREKKMLNREEIVSP